MLPEVYRCIETQPVHLNIELLRHKDNCIPVISGDGPPCLIIIEAMFVGDRRESHEGLVFVSTWIRQWVIVMQQFLLLLFLPFLFFEYLVLPSLDILDLGIKLRYLPLCIFYLFSNFINLLPKSCCNLWPLIILF